MNEKERSKITAVQIGSGAKLRIGTLQISGGYDVGVSADEADLSVGRALFDDVALPYDLRKMKAAALGNTEIRNDPKTRGAKLKGAEWTPPVDGPSLPSYCPKCEHVFASQNYRLTGAFFNLWGNQDTCVNCGYEEARLSEGHFKILGDAVEILRAPDITREMVNRLAQLGREVASGRLKPEEAVAAATAIHPKLGQAARLLLAAGTGAYLMYASLIGTVSATWDVWDRATAPDQAIVQQQVIERALAEHDRLWHEKLHEPQRREICETPKKQAKTKATSQKADDKTLKARAKRKNSNKKQKSRDLKEHRQSFGGARTR
ncbi:hypothetical protein GOL26_19225 [Sinorhizobium medicae]|nr:hypothetical protein [Sinorhizobium medicae]MDX1182649.1 hypothetical protein [Sinorhizobium medicae]